MKNLLYFIAGLLAVVCLQPSSAVASSHREAPLISNDPLADNTDLYAFRSPANDQNVVLIANYIPFEHPAGGPNWYSFGERIRYEIHVDNNAGTPGSEIIYRFEFKQMNEDPTTFFNIRLGKENLKTTYTCQRSMDGGRSFQTIISNGVVPPPNIGPRSIDNSTVGLGTTYDKQVEKGIMTASTGEKIFAGPVDDPFFVDLGIFDLGAVRSDNPRDAVARFNCHSIVIEVPIATLQRDRKPVSEAKNILDGDYVIGVYASASRQMIKTLYDGGDVGYDGEYRQVSRLGMPLTNEAIIPIGMKDRWNATKPSDDLQFAKYFSNPELALYMDDSQFGTAVPGLAPLRIQTNSLGAFDFRNGKPGLFSLKGTESVKGTALDEAAFGSILLPDNKSPRAVDLLPIFYTGVPNLPPYQLATGKGGRALRAGKPFINNFLPTLGDLLRLNMAVPVTPRTSADFSSLGLVQAAVLGLTDARYNASADMQFIPNMDGFPNGRRLEDDVTTIELQAVGGAVLAAIGLWYDDFIPGTTASPVTPNLVSVLGFKAGPTKNDKPFKTMFPYEAEPWRGFQGPSYEGKKVDAPAPPASMEFAVRVKSFSCTNGDIVFEAVNPAPGKTVEYSAAGVSVWTTNPNLRVEQELFWDNNSSGVLTLKARYLNEPGSQVSMEYDFRKQCSRARMAAEPTNATASFSINVLGNPTNKDVVAFDLRGNAGEAMEIGVSDASGRTLSHAAFNATGNVERRSVRIGRAPGIYFLKVGTPKETRTIKLLRE
ncbi:DUF4331 family protein [Persicitalea jodogahamensis]|uniref:DUF4331 domain-containing protein n=1 Tax=Persicitalea jodogahamensis TaxID=402147 RepID=A0A8J3D260_9BACT|nr:DUF4331 family protein [Persicitalea jodogahamensis]GHB56356.1 hypothetical protein GCM10007390_07110 [Persicitalea jodogahamensis]